MAIVDVKVPQLSESVAEATLLQWKKKPGEAVAQDEILIEIETDKVVLEVPAPTSGVIKQLVKNDGDSVTSDELIAQIDTEAAAQAAPAEAKAAPAAVAAAAPPDRVRHGVEVVLRRRAAQRDAESACARLPCWPSRRSCRSAAPAARRSTQC